FMAAAMAIAVMMAARLRAARPRIIASSLGRILPYTIKSCNTDSAHTRVCPVLSRFLLNKTAVLHAIQGCASSGMSRVLGPVPLRARVRPVVDGENLGVVELRITLRGGEGGMAQQLLYHPQVRPVHQKVRGIGMPQGVGRERFG